MTVIQFAPLTSQINPTFWHKLTQLKIDVLRLSDAQVPITATYTEGRLIKDREGGRDIGLAGSVVLDESSFDDAPQGVGKGKGRMKGVLKNFNTIEEFKSCDKAAMLNEVADKTWSSVTSDSEPELAPFLLLTYADLKKYKYFYWFAFPAFLTKPAWEVSGTIQPLSQSSELSSTLSLLNPDDIPQFFYVNGSKLEPISTFKPSQDTPTFGFIDPSPTPENPGWPVRNLLTHLLAKHHITRVQIVSWRGTPESSSLFTATVPGQTSLAPSPRPAAAGWERNPQGKLGPRMADLGSMMDPVRLSLQATALNLKLMRWRVLPGLDLEKIAAQKCLLLGAGTLGCYVARALVAYNTEKITLVDSSRVSFSNPARQPLFTFEDCVGDNGQGKWKAACAAERLKEVWKGVDAQGVNMSIPMPGHPIPKAEEEKAKKALADLTELVKSHDVIFLLMDSRESRWLPTVLGGLYNKIVLNAALGFDTFLVMRHGPRATAHAEHVKKTGKETKRLGCYYCNDIVAPGDSLTDRTLDQMCTVTRPGLAPIASASAVEMLMSLLMHPDGIHAPAPPTTAFSQTSTHNLTADDGAGILGLVPHQLRGFLANFRNMGITGEAFDRCTGCSEKILTQFASDPVGTLLNACNDTKYLEKVTGLDKLYEEGKAALEAMEAEAVDMSDEDDF
ncbi:E1-like protein-activating [Schizophyllum commune Loenen D]|nr:E1-like protein-activating [Schizophyllum commune Loenen D]